MRIGYIKLAYQLVYKREKKRYNKNKAKKKYKERQDGENYK